MYEHYFLDPDVIFLNHGSFGACPRPVFEVYQNWQLELERQPVAFLGRRAIGLLAEARARLGAFLGCGAENLVYFPNPTTALNMVARSLALGPGDEILTTDHEYGALDRTWRFICEKSGARYIRRPVPLPVGSQEEFIQDFWQGVTPRTRVIFISHITSPTEWLQSLEEARFNHEMIGKGRFIVSINRDLTGENSLRQMGKLRETVCPGNLQV